MVVSVNPFKPMEELYSEQLIFEYSGEGSESDLPPHLFSVANKAYTQLSSLGTPQSVIISGVFTEIRMLNDNR